MFGKSAPGSCSAAVESYRSQDAATMAAVQPHYSHETCRINVTVIYERPSLVLNNILTPPLPSPLQNYPIIFQTL